MNTYVNNSQTVVKCSRLQVESLIAAVLQCCCMHES